MATLRDPLARTSTVTPEDLDALRVSGMSSLGRGYEAGRIGTDINSAAAREASLRARAEQGDTTALAEAETLRSQIGNLQQRQALYAPKVGRVEDIGGVGDALSWAAGQVGQGAASMQDPLMVGTALQGAGRILGNGPGALKAVGAGLRGAGYVAPFVMNQRQMTGEAYNAMVEDQALMGRTSAAEREQNANLYGAGAGLLDTVVPGMIAGKLTGAGLRQGISQSGLGARTLKGMAMEGGTELVQQAGQQRVLGAMNPDRDTSGDFSENLNAFAGGAVGAGPMVMAGEMADSSYRRVGDTAQKVSAKTGEVVDLLSEKVGPTATNAKDKLGKVVDLFRGDDGKVTPGSVAGKVKDRYADFQARAEERDVISGMPPDTVDANNLEAYTQWLNENTPKRMQAVVGRLGKMIEEGDERAGEIYGALNSQDPTEQAEALDAASDHILSQDEWTEFEQVAAERTRQASRWVNKFGKMAGAAGRAAGGAAVDFGKSVMDGARKKNAQGMAGESLVGQGAVYDPQGMQLGAAAVDREAERWDQGKQRSYNRAKLMSEYLGEELKVAQAVPGTRMPQGSPEVMTGFMKDIGLELADLAENWGGPQAVKGDTAQAGVASPTKGREALAGPTSTLKATGDSKPQQFDGLVYNLNRIVRSLKVAYGQKADQVINELQAIDRNSAPELFDYMREELTVQNGPRAARHNSETERAMQDAVMASISDDVKVKMVNNGISLHTPAGKAQLVRMVKAVDDGVAPPAAAKALEQMIGKETLLAMRRTLRPSKASREDLVDDGGAVNGEGFSVNDDGEIDLNDQTNFDKALGETKAGKMRGPRMVRFGKSSMKLDRGAKGDVFAGEGKMTREQRLQFEDEFLQRMANGEEVTLPKALRRPALTKKGDKLFSGEDAVEGMLTRLEAEVGADVSPEGMRAALRRDAAAARKAGDKEAFERLVAQGKELGARMDANAADPALKSEARQFFTDRSENGKWGARAVSVSQYMKEEGYDPIRKLSLYRDYMRQDLVANAKAMTAEQKAKAMADLRQIGVVMSDATDQKAGKAAALRLSPGERRSVLDAADKFFDERYMAVAEQMTDAAPEQLTAGEVKAMGDLGDRIYEYARTLKGEGEAARFVSEANVLVFKGVGKTKEGNPVAVRIPAKELAKWGKDQRETYDSGTTEQGSKAEKDERFDNTTKDMQYLRDLMLGITALMDSGVVDTKAMPYKINQFGQSEFFSKAAGGSSLDGLPESLALATDTVFAVKKRKAKPARQFTKEEIERQKMREWSDESFVAAQDASAEGVDPYQLWGDLRTVKSVAGRASGDGRALASAVRESNNKRTASYKTTDPDALASDYSVPDGFDDVRTRTKAQGRDARKMPLPQNEIPLTAASRAQQRADEIVRHFMPQTRDEKLEAGVVGVPKATAAERYEYGSNLLMQRMNVARQDKRDGGGAQYAIPVVVALTDDNIARMDVTAEEAKALAAMRVEAMQLIDGSDLNKTLKAKFGALAAPAKNGKPPVDAAGAIQKRQDYLDNPPADYTSEKAQSIMAWAKAGLSRAEARKAELSGEEREAMADNIAALKRLVAKAESVLEGDASLADFEGTTAAKGVGASLGKPSGVGEAAGRKLNAQNEEGQDGTDRLISRRADARADKFSTFNARGVRQTEGGAFGPITDTRRFFATADGGTHTFAVPTQLLSLLSQTVSKYPDSPLTNILRVFAVQHTFYDQTTKKFQSFGPDPRAPAGKLLEGLGALRDTGEVFEHGVPITSVAGVTRSQTVDFMADALAYARQIEGTPKVYVEWKRVTGANVGKTFKGWLNAQQPDNKASTQAERDAAIAEVKKTLGDDIAVRFEQLTGYSGEYLDKDAAIVISMTPAAGTLQTAYHEALHAFVARLVRGNEKAQRVLNTLANHEPTMERVMALLAGHPEALKQLIDGEGRIAYIYQFWRAGLLDLPATQGAGMLQKLRRFFRGMLGRISDLERSSALLEAFSRGAYAGNPSVAGKVLAKTLSEGAWGAKTMRKMDGLVQKVAALTVPAQSLLLMSDSPTAQKLGTTFWTNPGDEDAGGMQEGYLNARERMAKRYTNEFSRIVNGFTERDHKEVARLLQAEVDPTDVAYQPHREAVEKIRALLQRFRTYMVDERGMRIGDRGPLYFPRVWSPHALVEKKAEFMEMMRANHPTYDAEAVYNAVLKKFEQNTEDSLHGREDDDAALKPAQGAGNERILDFITGEQAQPFLEQSLVGTLSRYFHEGARAAEYTARFGQTGRKLEKALSMVHAELRAAGKKRRDDGELKDQDAETKWVARQMRDVANAVDAMEGTLGRDISDGWRKANSWVTVYQNVRLLPMALFSSIVDPLGMMARGASMRDAYDGFLRGMSEVVRNWGEMITGETKERKADKWERLAMAVGSVDAAVFNHHVSDEYASVFMSAGAKKINDFMFKANGMEAWNRGMRVAATRAAALFILRHKSLPDVHSERWLKEIGLTPSDIHVDANGDLITNKHALAAQLGVDVVDAAKRVERVHYAINRWVQGAVLTPNAAQRPAWGSDPHYSMFFHLKQFSYSFHQTILKRAVNEMNHGNLAPMGAFAWYIPVMIASDITKGLIQGGGELPAHMKGMDLGDWVAHGAERAGLLGLGQIGMDAGQDIASVGGPAVEQIIDAYSDPLERTMVKAAPAHGLFAEALK